MNWDALQGINLTRKQQEQRRLLAGDDLIAGMKQADVARKFCVHPSNVSRWAKILKEEGKSGLLARKATGKKAKLNSNQKNELVGILVAGARSYGFNSDYWTGKRVCEVIRKEFGISYHFKHVPKLLRTLDFRLVKPKRQAIEKDKEKKQEWIKTTWVQLKKTSK